MVKNDYVMRMIEQLSAVIGQIIGLKNQKKFKESQEILNTTLKRYLGLNLQSLDILSYKDLIRIISAGEKPDSEKCIILAELLKQESGIYEAQGNYINAYSLQLKSLNILIEVLLADADVYSEQYLDKINEIINLVKVYEIPSNTKGLLFQFYELTGSYDKAEDVFFEWLESEKNSKDIINKGIAFYKRLMNKGEEELIEGNLPVNEVVESLNKLQEYPR